MADTVNEVTFILEQTNEVDVVLFSVSGEIDPIWEMEKGDYLKIADAMNTARQALSGTNPIVFNQLTGAISILVANATQGGYLTKDDWATFNSKQAALGYTPENVANKGTANGYVPLGVDGKVPSEFLPAVSLGERFSAASQSAMLALNAQIGDMCVRTDQSNQIYLLTGSNPATLSNWIVLNAPYPVTSVNGQGGNVNLTTSDITEGTNQYFTAVRARNAIANTATLTDAATIAVDASQGYNFSVTLGGNRTLGNPTNAVDGQKMLFRIKQDGTGNRTLALGTKYRFGADIVSITLSTQANKSDYLGVIYNQADDKFDIIAFMRGF